MMHVRTLEAVLFPAGNWKIFLFDMPVATTLFTSTINLPLKRSVRVTLPQHLQLFVDRKYHSTCTTCRLFQFGYGRKLYAYH